VVVKVAWPRLGKGYGCGEVVGKGRREGFGR
jgi:hypothetical protein